MSLSAVSREMNESETNLHMVTGVQYYFTGYIKCKATLHVQANVKVICSSVNWPFK